MIVARRYAKSLLTLALEKGVLEAVYADMKLIGSICDTNSDFVNMLHSPLVKTDVKQKLVDTIFGGKINEVTAKFLHLLAAKRREEYLDAITHEFESQYKVYKQIITAIVTSATPLDAVSREQLLAIIRKNTTLTVEVEERVDKKLIGGFKINIGDVTIDSSVLRKLNDLKQEFAKNPFVKGF